MIRASVGANDEIVLRGDVESAEAEELMEIVRDSFNRGLVKGFAQGFERGQDSK